MIGMKKRSESTEVAASGGHLLNTGDGKCLQILDLQHPTYVAAIEPDRAFWSLVEKSQLAHAW